MIVKKKIILCFVLTASLTSAQEKITDRVSYYEMMLEYIPSWSLSNYVPESLNYWYNNTYEWLFDAKAKLRETLTAFKENPYRNAVAQIRIGNELCEKEQSYLAIRKDKVKSALEQLCNCRLTDDQVPTIAIACSGGGYRAVAAILGFLLGAQKIGLLDATTYITSLSGSAWLMASWMSSGMPLADFKVSLVEKMCKGLSHIGAHGAVLLADSLLVKYAADQPITMVDFYGGLLANVLLKDHTDYRQMTYLSAQEKIVSAGDMPLPIYTAVNGDEMNPCQWYEFTPFEIGSAWTGCYVPSWAFGREFKAGESVDFDPEQSLGYQMGIFGSAFSASFGRIYDEFKHNIYFNFTKYVIETLFAKASQKRVAIAKLYNFAYQVPTSPTAESQKIYLMDAGIAFNLPYPPISGQRAERTADIIIFLDASADTAQAAALRSAEQYACEHNLKFPVIDYREINLCAMSVFRDEQDPTVPIVIYMPLVRDTLLWQSHKQDQEFVEYQPWIENFDPKDCAYCSTFDFVYEREQLYQLSGLTEFNMRANKNDILNVLRYVLTIKAK
jgi:phospholipase A2